MNHPEGHGGLPANPFHPHAWFVGEPRIGEGCWIGAFCVIDGSGGLSIGRGCNLSAGTQIYTHSTVARCISEGERPIERRSTTLGDYVYVGANAVILMGSVIGDHCVVAAGAVVAEGTTAPPFSVLRGVPAQVIPGAARKFAAEHVSELDNEPS
ncbi:DapH/DapD/GlmU-related protein [Leucobacter manosquensis]|uniref:Acyltransferase n=1 Tax=Leucobacter manosquensis TaxID=2810611 RepID=A0ABS5M4E2_9MICO|nr:DapH/DapD/GlmU-related protein [Leucobacter manosquensis]MBS3182063.1 acyltransferase [Leucobacter manosquensis]